MSDFRIIVQALYKLFGATLVADLTDLEYNSCMHIPDPSVQLNQPRSGHGKLTSRAVVMSQQRPLALQDDILEVLEKLPRRLSQTTSQPHIHIQGSLLSLPRHQ